MTPKDLVYNEVYKSCLSAGCADYIAKDAAVMAVKKFKCNQFTKVSELIKTSISEAKKLNVKKKR